MKKVLIDEIELSDSTLEKIRDNCECQDHIPKVDVTYECGESLDYYIDPFVDDEEIVEPEECLGGILYSINTSWDCFELVMGSSVSVSDSTSRPQVPKKDDNTELFAVRNLSSYLTNSIDDNFVTYMYRLVKNKIHNYGVITDVSQSKDTVVVTIRLKTGQTFRTKFPKQGEYNYRNFCMDVCGSDKITGSEVNIEYYRGKWYPTQKLMPPLEAI